MRRGKYLMVIRASGRAVEVPRLPREADAGVDADPVVAAACLVDHAFAYASRAVLDLLFNDMQLLPRLRCGTVESGCLH